MIRLFVAVLVALAASLATITLLRRSVICPASVAVGALLASCWAAVVLLA